MNLDTTTLIVAGSFVAAFTGLVLIAARTQIPATPALVWWAAANFVTSAGIACAALRPPLGDVPPETAGLAMLGLGPVLVWTGFRRFNHRHRPWLLLTICAIILAATAITADAGDLSGVTFLAFGSSVAFLGASVVELWRGRREQLNSRWSLMGFLIVNAVVYAGGLIELASGQYAVGSDPALRSWFGLIYFEGLVYLIGTAVFMVLMCAERSERHKVKAARKDSLTGIANRGDFLEGAERLLQRARSDGTSFSVIMFDLDEFKSINDTFGHNAGDAVIRRFAEIARSMLRPTDLFGRYGGEEFVVALPKATIEAAYVIAERIRYAFSTAALVVDDQAIPTSVSGGVAAAGVDTTIDLIVRAADSALYRAKRLGRNRIERTGDRPAEAGDDDMIRVA